MITNEEVINAIKIIAAYDCDGKDCNDCLFALEGDHCISAKFQKYIETKI